MWEDGSKMRDFPTLLEKGRETNQNSMRVWFLSLQTMVVSTHFKPKRSIRLILIEVLISFYFLVVVDVVLKFLYRLHVSPCWVFI